MRFSKGQSIIQMAMVSVLALAGCSSPFATGASGEGQLGTPRLSSPVLHALTLRGPDGQPLQGAATVRINGKLYPTSDGKVLLPQSVLNEAVAAGGLVVTTPGFAPVRLPVHAELVAKLNASAQAAAEGKGAQGAAEGEALTVQLPWLREEALPSNLGLAGGMATLPDGGMSVLFPPGLLKGNASVVAAAYTPQLGADLAQQQAKELAALQAAVSALGGKPFSGGSGAAASTGGNCGVPFACQSPTQALGISLTVDGAISPEGGQIKTNLDLALLLRGWNGEGNPPWEVDPSGWSEAAKSDALAAAKILASFKAMDATGDPTWRKALQQVHGLELNGDLLSFPVQVNGQAASADGLTRVQVNALSVLGVALELTVMSSVGQALPQGLAPSTQLGGAKPVGLGGVAGNLGGGTVLAAGGAAGQALTKVVTNGPQLIANQGGNLISNNGSTLVAGVQLLSNNGSALISNHGGAIMGSAYLPMVPPIAQYRLFQLGVPETPRLRTTAGGVKEYLWTDSSVRVRAAAADGRALTDWMPTNAQGTYTLPIEGETPAAFFVEVEGLGGTVFARAIAFAPGKQHAWVEVNSASTVLAQNTRFLQAFLPAEIDAVGGMYDYVTDSKSPYQGKAEGAAVGYLDARSQELTGALSAINLALYGSDVARTQGVQSQASAEQNMRSQPPVEVYDRSYAGSYTFTSLQLVSRFTQLPPP